MTAVFQTVPLFCCPRGFKATVGSLHGGADPAESPKGPERTGALGWRHSTRSTHDLCPGDLATPSPCGACCPSTRGVACGRRHPVSLSPTPHPVSHRGRLVVSPGSQTLALRLIAAAQSLLGCHGGHVTLLQPAPRTHQSAWVTRGPNLGALG